MLAFENNLHTLFSIKPYVHSYRTSAKTLEIVWHALLAEEVVHMQKKSK